jgi:hypothetical protein
VNLSKHTPVEITTSDEPVEKVVLFVIDGKPYEIEAEARVDFALQLLDDVEKYGPEIAQMRLLRKLLGEEAWQALSTCKSLKRDQMSKISQTVQSFTLGALEETSGN